MIPKVETRQIMGHTYMTTLFPAMRGYLLARKLLGVITTDDPIGKLCEIDKTGDLILEVLSTTTRDEQVINAGSFNVIYTGNYKELIGALNFVYEANFKDFLQEKDTGEEKTKVEVEQPFIPLQGTVSKI